MHWKALEHWRRLHLNLHHPKIRKNIMNNLPASNNVLLFSSFIMALISWRFHMNLAFILICNAYMLKVCYKVNSIIDLNTSGTLNTIPDHRNGICEQYWQLTNPPPVSFDLQPGTDECYVYWQLTNPPPFSLLCCLVKILHTDKYMKLISSYSS